MEPSFMSLLPKRFSFKYKITSPQFTRRHYIWLTAAMRELLHEATKDGATKFKVDAIKYSIETFAEALAADNPRFNKEQFLSNIFPSPEQKG